MLDNNLYSLFNRNLGNVSGNNGDATILFIGDSTTAGVNDAGFATGNQIAFSWPVLTSKILASRWPVSSGFLCSNNLTDARVSLTGNFALGTGNGFANNCYAVSSAGTLVFTPGDGVSYDSFKVIIAGGGSGTSTLSAQATGGSATNVNVNAGQYAAATITGTAGTSNSLTLTWESGSVKVVSVEAFNSTVSRVRFANAGVSGAKCSDWIVTNSLNSINTYKANLHVIMIGINDAAANSPLPTFQSNLATLVNTCLQWGNVILMSVIPSQSGYQFTLESQYAVIQNAMASSVGASFVDVFNDVFGASYQNAYMQGNTEHPTQAGYQIIANAVASLLS